jgi:hypothetical protein
VKYYLYVSDTKLDMLYAQIPRPVLERLAVELKVDLKVLGVVLRTNPLEDETRYAKLEVVTKYLEREGYVGTIDEPAEYFKGPVTMTWGFMANPFTSPERRLGPWSRLTGRSATL